MKFVGNLQLRRNKRIAQKFHCMQLQVFLTKNMRMVGRIGTKEVVILVNTSSTHTFLDLAIVIKAGLTLQPTKTIKVKIANGESIFCEGRCDQVALRVQGHTFTTEFYALTLGGCDIILGVYWLKDLGPILWGFCQLTMAFVSEGKEMQLRRLHSKEWIVEDAKGFHISS